MGVRGLFCPWWDRGPSGLGRAAPLFLLAFLAGSCVEELDVTESPLPVLVRVEFVPELGPDLANTPRSLRIHTARVEALLPGPEPELTQAVVSLDPDDLPRAVEIRFDLPEGAEISLQGTVELLHEPGEDQEASTEWAAAFGPVTVTTDPETWSVPVTFGRGPLAQLPITDLTLTGGPASVLEGETLILGASVQGGPAEPLVFWGSRNEAVAVVDDEGVVTTLTPGRADIVAAAGLRHRSVEVEVLQAVSSIAVLPDTAVLTSIFDEATFTLVALDSRGDPITDRELDPEWEATNGQVAVHAGGGVFQPAGSGITDVIARLDGLEAYAVLVVELDVGSLVLESGDGQSATVGSALDPFVVRVLDSGGLPVAGTTVEWSILEGDGELSETATVSGAEGFTQTVYTLGPSAGAHGVRARVQGTFLQVDFSAVAEAGAPAALVVQSGSGQQGQAGEPLPEPLVVRVEDAFGNPVQGAAIAWTSDSGTVDPASAETDQEGLAAAAWTPGGELGTRTATATLGDLAGAAFEADIGPGPPDRILVAGGDDQEAPVEEPLPEPLVVEVLDRFDNPVPGVTVAWTAEAGSLTSASSTTDEEGRATTTWTMGPESGFYSAAATVGDLEPAVFTALAVPSEPFLRLELVEDDRVGVDRDATLRVTLTPEPAEEVLVEFTVDDPARLALSRDSILVPAGAPETEITVTGLSQGTTTVRASAEGYLDGALPVEVTLRIISLPSTLNVAFGGTASIPVQLAEPAPPGGLTVSLASDDPEAVEVLTPTVSFAEGQLTVNGTVAGVTPGSATVTATHPDYVTGTSQVASTAALQIVETSLTINESFGGSIRIRLTSAGSPVAAPAPGIVVALEATDPACVAVAAEATIATGLTEVVVPVSWAGEAETSCSSVVTATSPDIDPADVPVTVNPVPPINLSTTVTGAGLQRAVSGSLGASNHGGTTLTLTSDDPEQLLLAPNASTAGQASIQIQMAAGSTGFSYVVQGLEGQSGTVAVTATATGFATGQAEHTVVVPSMDIIFLSANSTTLSADDPFQARLGLPNGQLTALAAELATRAGGPGIAVTVTTSDPEIALLTTTDLASDEVVVPVTAGQARTPGSVGAGGVAFNPQGAGVVTVTASAPGFVSVTTGSQQVTVTPPQISLFESTTGGGLQRAVSGSLGATAHGGVTLTLTSENPEVLLLAPDASTPGAASIEIPMADGTSGFSYWIQGVEGADGEAQVTGTASGFDPGQAVHLVMPPSMDIIFLSATSTTLSAPDPFQARTGLANQSATGLAVELAVRAGSPGLEVSVLSSDGAVGLLETLEDTADSVAITVAPGQSRSPSTVASGGVAFVPAGAGVTTVRLEAPGFAPMTTSSRDITVTASQITLSATTTGSGLHRGTSGSLGATGHDGVTVTLTSADPEVLLLSPNASTAGSASIEISVSAGTAGFSYWVQGVEAATGQVPVTASATGFLDGGTTHVVDESGLDIIFLSTSTTTLSADDPFQIRTGLPNAGRTALSIELALRAGGPGGAVTVTSSNPSVGRLVTLEEAGTPVAIGIPAGQSRSPATVAGGGVAFDPLTAGTTVVEASIPGVVTMTDTGSREVTVSAPAINLNSTSVGGGLQRAWSGSLGGSAHGGVTVTLTSSNPDVLVLSASGTVAGQGTLEIFVPDGNSAFSFWLQGMEEATGTPTVTASAPGFTDNQVAFPVVEGAFDLIFLSTSQTAGGADNSFQVRLGLPNSNNTGLSFELQARGGGPGFQAQLDNSNAEVATLVTQEGTGQVATVQIGGGQSRSPSTLATGGVSFRPIAPGTTTVTGTVPGLLRPNTGSVTVNVN